jgi:CRP/FNR family cyclic AMP-dependent transcriptional regulator
MDAPQLPTASMEQVELPKGSILFEQDQRATHVFVLRTGVVRLMRRVFRESFLVEEIGKGGVCGEVAIAGNALYPVRAEIVEDAVVLAIPTEQLDDVVSREPTVAALLARKIAARLAYSHYRLASFALRSPEARVLYQLRHEAARAGGLAGGIWVDVPWDLPQALHLEGGTLRVVLDRLSERALIEIDANGRFRVVDLAAYDRRLAYLELSDRYE